MDSFEGKIAVVTGAGTGMGRELALQLAAAGANLALCDVNAENLASTAERCRAHDPSLTVSTAEVDVTDEAALERFRDATMAEHATDHIHLLFNNAGIGGTASFLDPEARKTWERTFDVCWQGVYLTSRVFLPLVVAAAEGHVINTSSINGIWASLGPSRTHTAYSAAKFAVRGFTEALITDLRLNAPHVRCSVVMPGHIGTDIVTNSRQILDGELDAEATEIANAFRNEAPTTAATAATVILDGVREGRWRILIGEDAAVLDGLLRDQPENAYEQDFVDQLHAMGVLNGLVG
ncbi:MAG: SDR family NAD(P)-dependent oxidoreductase [Actinomycetota bacterium]